MKLLLFLFLILFSVTSNIEIIEEERQEYSLIHVTISFQISISMSLSDNNIVIETNTDKELIDSYFFVNTETCLDVSRCGDHISCYDTIRMCPGQTFDFMNQEFIIISGNKNTLFAFSNNINQNTIKIENFNLMPIIKPTSVKKKELDDYLSNNILNPMITVNFVNQRLKKLSNVYQYFEKEIENVDLFPKQFHSLRLLSRAEKVIDDARKSLKNFNDLYSYIQKELKDSIKEEEKEEEFKQ